MGDAEPSADVFVGNISYQTTEKDIEDLFVEYGKVKEVRIAVDRGTGRSKGFAFVKMEESDSVEKALKGLVGAKLYDREIRVEMVTGGGGRRRDDRDRRDDRGYRGGGGGGGGYRGDRRDDRRDDNRGGYRGRDDRDDRRRDGKDRDTRRRSRSGDRGRESRSEGGRDRSRERY